MKFRLNLKKSLPDARDWSIRLQSPQLSLPVWVNLMAFCPQVYDQGDIGSCTAQSASCMYATVFHKKSKQRIDPSRLFIYYNTRSIQNTLHEDSGATLRDTMKALRRYGVCQEKYWIYANIRLFQKPTPVCYQEGQRRQVLSYASVPLQLNTMKQLLYQKHAFVIGFLVYPSFFTSGDTVPVPNPASEPLLGGHAVCIIGYDDRRQAFLARNSWGLGWGVNGNFYFPYLYATNPNLSFDAWVLYNIEIPAFRIRKPLIKKR